MALNKVKRPWFSHGVFRFRSVENGRGKRQKIRVNEIIIWPPGLVEGRPTTGPSLPWARIPTLGGTRSPREARHGLGRPEQRPETKRNVPMGKGPKPLSPIQRLIRPIKLAFEQSCAPTALRLDDQCLRLKRQVFWSYSANVSQQNLGKGLPGDTACHRVLALRN